MIRIYRKTPPEIQCKKCGKIKPLSEFHKNKKSLFGVKKSCQECCSRYRKKHYKKNIKRAREYYEFNRERIQKYRKDLLKKYPWYNSWNAARSRCLYKTHRTYRWYGGRGIKMLLTFKEIGKLWYRDKAYLMKKPSIDRKNNNGDYTLENCHFIELVDNRKKTGK